MEIALHQFLDAGLAASTKKVYAAGWNRYQGFTQSFQLASIPTTVENVTLFVSYLAAPRHFQLRLDPSNTTPSFHSPHMSVLLQGICRSQALQGPRRVRLPITATLMRRIKLSLGNSPKAFDNVLIWAACCVGFFGFLRCGEFLVPDGASYDPPCTICPSLTSPCVSLTLKQPCFLISRSQKLTDSGKVLQLLWAAWVLIFAPWQPYWTISLSVAIVLALCSNWKTSPLSTDVPSQPRYSKP